MSDRSKSVIEVTLEASQADAVLDKLQQKADRLSSSLKGVSIGAGEGGGGAGGSSRAMEAATQTIQTALAETMAHATEAIVDSNATLTSSIDALDGALGDLAHEIRTQRLRDDQDKDREPKRRRGFLGTGISNLAAVGAGAGGVVGGGLAGSPGAVLGGLGAMVTGITEMLGDLLDVPLIGPLIKSAGTFAGAGLGMMGMVAQHRFGIAQQRAGYERAGMWAPLSGAGYNEDSGIPFGMSPAEAAGQASAASMAAGVAGSMANVDLFTLMKSGVGAGAIGSLAGTAAQYGSGGSPYGDARMLQAVFSAGLKDGLRGSRLEGVLSQLQGSLEAAGAAGAMLDMTATGNLTANMAQAVRGKTGKGGAFRAMSGLTAAPMSARQSLLAPFAAAQDGLMLAHAAQGGGSITDIIGRLETMGPEGALEALNAAPGVGEMIMGGFGLSVGSGAARDALGASSSTPGSLALPGLTEAGGTAQEAAKTAAQNLKSMSAADAIAMIKSMNALQNSLNVLARALDVGGATNKMIGNIEALLRIIAQNI